MGDMNVVAVEQTKEFAIAQISAARRALTEANDIYAVLDVRGMAVAAVAYFEAQNAREAADIAKEVQLRAERKAGQMLEVMPKNKGSQGRIQEHLSGADTMSTPDSTPTLADLDIRPQESSRWQLVASVPDARFEEYIDERRSNGYELTAGGLIQIAKAIRDGKPHVSFSTGNNEWYTPSEYIEAARRVMGEIDLDPASSEIANETVGAAVYFTAEDDGLRYEWDGRVWMNPPYASELIGLFTGKLVRHFETGGVTEAIALVNNATETGWFNSLVSVASAVVFPRARVKFNMPGGETGAPLQGQAVVYLGDRPDLFLDEFCSFGWGAEVCRR